MEIKFPFETGEMDIEFEWFESFMKQKSNSILKLESTTCIQYEKASVLYNIASIYSHLGSAERKWTLDGQRKASSFFQQAAGVLMFIRNVSYPQFKIKLGSESELHESSLQTLAAIMLAQASECFYHKSNDGKSLI